MWSMNCSAYALTASYSRDSKTGGMAGGYTLSRQGVYKLLFISIYMLHLPDKKK